MFNNPAYAKYKPIVNAQMFYTSWTYIIPPQ